MRSRTLRQGNNRGTAINELIKYLSQGPEKLKFNFRRVASLLGGDHSKIWVYGVPYPRSALITPRVNEID